LPTSLVAQFQPAAETRPIVFNRVTVVDMTGAPPKPNMTVIVVGSRISAVGKTGKVSLPENARIIDASGKFLIPGLWDMHIHSGGYENGRKYFPGLVANGITGVRDMGTPLEEILRLRKEANHGKFLAPRMIIAGHLLQGPLPFKNPVFLSVNNKAEASQAVINLKKNGVNFIKIHDAVPRDIYFAIAAEAKRQGLPLAGHVPPFVSAAETSNAEQQSIEHLGGRFHGVLLACSSRETELSERIKLTINDMLKAFSEKREPDDSAIFRAGFTKLLFESFSERKAMQIFLAFRKNKTSQVPTLVAQPLRAAVNERKDLSKEDIFYAGKLMQKQFEIVAAMQRAGVKIMAGTDSPLDKPKLHEELALLVEAGLTPMQALQTATSNPAKFLGLEKLLGTIEKGKEADFVLLDANPLDNIANTKRISGVVFGGRYFSKDKLEEMLRNAEVR
ncbi:MAG TPA: amidohydrolase family protein, partial [Pyrinomonadaceae bacterium]|nr:amidohydrolase family protein [Pyrinomonadaceae bacterium]